MQSNSARLGGFLQFLIWLFYNYGLQVFFLQIFTVIIALVLCNWWIPVHSDVHTNLGYFAAIKTSLTRHIIEEEREGICRAKLSVFLKMCLSADQNTHHWRNKNGLLWWEFSLELKCELKSQMICCCLVRCATSKPPETFWVLFFPKMLNSKNVPLWGWFSLSLQSIPADWVMESVSVFSWRFAS